MMPLNPPPLPTNAPADERPRPDRPSGPDKPSRAITLVVVAIVVLAAVSLAVFIYIYSQTTSVDGFHGMTVSVRTLGSNWSVEVLGTTGGRTVPAGLYIEVRNPQGFILLNRTSFASLTLANWTTNRALYQDWNPGVPEVSPGDAILLEIATYPGGCYFAISESGGMLAAGTLR